MIPNMSKATISSPAKGFIIIVDNEGIPQEVFSNNCVIDKVFTLKDRLDRNNPDDAPHSVWEFIGSGFSLVKDRL